MPIDDPAVWKLLMSPVRVEIAESLRSLGASSVREVADFLDRPADALYRHVALLEEAGLVVEAGFRRGARNAERLIDLAADDFTPTFDQDDGDAPREAVFRTVDTLTKATRRIVHEAGEQRPFRFDEDGRNIVVGWEIGWLRPEDVDEAYAIRQRLKALMDRGKEAREGRPFVSLILLSEIAHKRGAARNAPSTNGNKHHTDSASKTNSSQGDRT